MRTILLIVLGLFIAQTIEAQSDSLIIKLDDYGQMIILSKNIITEKKKSLGLDSSYQNFYNDFKGIDKSKFTDKDLIVKYLPKNYEPQYRTISIEIADNTTDIYYFHENKKQSIQQGKLKLELTLARKVILFVNNMDDLEKINQLDIDSLYLQALNHIQSQSLNKKTPYKIFYSSENKTIDKNSNLIYTGKSTDYLLLTPTVGMSVIDSRVAPEWGASIEFDLRRKGLAFQKFGINYSTMYLPAKDDFYNISSYGFLSLHYFFRYESKYIHKISVGYLVNKTGNDFNGTTWNAFWTTNFKDIGFKIGGIHTKNTEGKYVTLPSVGINIEF